MRTYARQNQTLIAVWGVLGEMCRGFYGPFHTVWIWVRSPRRGLSGEAICFRMQVAVRFPGSSKCPVETKCPVAFESLTFANS